MTRLTPCEGATLKESWLLEISTVSSMRGWWVTHPPTLRKKKAKK